MKVRGIVKSPLAATYLAFVSGVQISACVELLIGLYDVILSFERFVSVVSGGLLLGAGAYFSAFLAWEINDVIHAGEKARGTIIGVGELMDEKLDEEVTILFKARVKLIDRITVHLCSDVVLTVLGLCLIIAIRLLFP